MARFNNLHIGASAQMAIADFSDRDDYVRLLVRVDSQPAQGATIPYAWSIDGVRSPWYFYALENFPLLEHVTIRYVPTQLSDNEFTFHIGDTGTPEIGGPHDLTINLLGYNVDPATSFPLHIKHNGEWVNAAAYVNDNGEWKRATPHLKQPNGWKEIK